MYFISFLDRSATEVNTPRAITSRSIFANQISTWLSHEEYVGVKWNFTLGLSSRNSLTALVLWAERLSSTMWISLSAGVLSTMCVRKLMNSALVWRAVA